MSTIRPRVIAYTLLLALLLVIVIPQPVIYAAPDATPAPELKSTRVPVPADKPGRLPAELLSLFEDALSTTSPAAVHFDNCAFNTGNNASVATPSSMVVSDLTLGAGDEIAIFTPDGSICAGVQVWDGTNTAIAAWGDDTQTDPVDGLQSGEEMKYRIWDSSTQTEHEYCQENYAAGDGLSSGLYEPDSFHVLEALIDCSAQQTIFNPVADAYVRSNYPTTNFGSNSDLRIKDAAVDINSYLKFDVQGLPGTVQAATLKLYVNDASDDGGTAYVVNDTSWAEETITWNNAPAMGSAMGSAGQVSNGQWAEIDVTDAVAGNGLTSIGIRSASADVVFYSSKEGTNAPKLLVVYAGGQAQPPVAEFSADPVSGTAPLDVQFTDLSSGSPTSWSWDFGDGGTSTEQNPNHNYTTPGQYTVSLTATNGEGSDAETKVDYINVGAASPIVCLAPVADAYVKSNYPTSNFGSRADLRAKDASADIMSYLKFNVQGVTGVVQSATLRLYVTDASDDGGTAYLVNDTSWDEGTITWNSAPAMGSAMGSAGQVSNGQWAEIDVTDAVAGNGLTSIGIKNASKDLVVYSSKEGANVPELCVGYASGQPQPPIANFTADPLSGGAPLDVQFTDTSTGVPTSWSWDFGDGGSSTQQNPNHTYTAPGQYTVTLTATNGEGSDQEIKTNYINVTTSSTVCVAPVADAYVHSSYPKNNYGTRSDVRTKDAAADINSYLKFDVQGLTGAVQAATLKLYVNDASDDGGTAYVVTNTSWDEATITWKNAPAMSAAMGKAGPVSNAQWVEIDVTAAVAGNGLTSIGLKNASKDLVVYSSKEGTDTPELCVTYNAAQVQAQGADSLALPGGR